jgi:hypothetical protein
MGAGLFLGDARRHLQRRLIMQARHERFVAVRTAIAALITHAGIDPKVTVELAELAFQVIVPDQSAAAAEHSALRQVGVASQEPPTFLERTAINPVSSMTFPYAVPYPGICSERASILHPGLAIQLRSRWSSADTHGNKRQGRWTGQAAR